MNKLLVVTLCLLICCAPIVCAEPSQGEGFDVRDGALVIRLWENPGAGYSWTCEVDELLELSGESSPSPRAEDPSGAPFIHVWEFTPRRDGDALITMIYDLEDDPEMVGRMMCYTVTIQGGAITDVEMEDLSEDIEGSGDDDAVVPYDGETGGVELNVPEGMVETETEDGALLTSEDGARTILIDYQPDDSADELFEQLKDRDSAAEVYEGEDGTDSVISSMVDLESDPPCVTLVLTTSEGYTVYTGYQAPEGGVLHVHTTYLFGEGE